MSYTIESNLLNKTGLTAGQLQSAESALQPANGYHPDVWQAIIDAENQYGLNALFILAHADIESAHGNSNYAKTRNNLFGFNAIDSNPDLASSYSSQRVSVIDYAEFLSNNYLRTGGKYWGGEATPHGVFVHYSSSHDVEANQVVEIMNTLLSHVNNQPIPAPQPAPAPIPTGNTYIVKQNDNMSNIATSHGLSLIQLEQLNPGAGHPVGNYGNIWPGDVLKISGSPPQPSNSPQYYTVVKNDNMSTIAAKHGLSFNQLVAFNLNAGHPARNYNNIWPGDILRIK